MGCSLHQRGRLLFRPWALRPAGFPPQAQGLGLCQLTHPRSSTCELLCIPASPAPKLPPLNSLPCRLGPQGPSPCAEKSPVRSPPCTALPGINRHGGRGCASVPPVTPPLSALCPHGLAQGRHRGGNQNISVYSWSGSQLPWKQGSVATSLTLEVGVTEGSSVLALQDQPRTTILGFLWMQSHLRQSFCIPGPQFTHQHRSTRGCLGV